MSEGERVTGSVKWFNVDKGFGFIKLPNGSLDVFVHVHQLRRSGIERALLEGESVSFVVGKGPKGSFATDINLLEAKV